MKRFLSFLSKGVIAILLLIVVAFFIMESQAPSYLSRSFSEKLQVPVSIESISISPSSIGVKGLTIANVPHSYLPKALSIQTITCENSLWNYLDKNIVIEEIHLDNIYLGLEFDSPKGTKGNWTTLMQNVQKEEPAPSQKNNKSVTIKQLVLTNIQTEVVYHSSGKSVKKLPVIPKIVLYNINSNEGIPTQEIMQSVLGQMLKSVFVEENLKNMFEGILDQPQNIIDNLLQPFKGLF